MVHRTDPRYTNSLIDAHVLDGAGTPADATVDKILHLAEECKVLLLLPHSVKSEIEHPRTPSDIKRRAAKLLYTTPVQLTPTEVSLHRKIRNILQGNAKLGKHDSDAYHIVESAKYGGYFVTKDKRIHRKKTEIAALLRLTIVTPVEFLDLYDSFNGSDPSA